MSELNQTFEWAVIGAGPAGITTVGNLLEYGVDPNKIIWIDPHFAVGDFGVKWPAVPSNTKVQLFLRFLQELSVFQFSKAAKHFPLLDVDPQQTCELHLMAEPLQWITECLVEKVCTLQGKVEHVQRDERGWILYSDQQDTMARNIVLAIGAEPRQLHYANLQEITLAQVFSTEQLQQCCSADDVVAVFGSSHSAVLAIRRLLEAGVTRIINFYLSPLRYAVYFDDWILFDNTGLKGTTADWARQHLEGTLPANMQRFVSNNNNIENHLPQCNKVVYAIGFEPRSIPIMGVPQLDYNDKCGIIARGLFGCGIAFPEGQMDRVGNYEHRVGLWKFMEYIKRVMPTWMRYQ